MGAFDLITKTIKSDEWDEGEEVVIREMTYAESLEMQQIMMSEMSMKELQAFSTQKKATMLHSDDGSGVDIKASQLNFTEMALSKMERCIVSWTFQQDGKPIPVSRRSIQMLGTKYGTFINKKIEEINPNLDAEFQGESESDLQEGQGGITA